MKTKAEEILEVHTDDKEVEVHKKGSNNLLVLDKMNLKDQNH